MIKNFIQYISSEKRYSSHTILAYEADLTQYQSFLLDYDATIDLESSTHSHVRLWILSLVESNINPKSVNRKLASLRSFYNYLQKRKLVSLNPVKQIKPLKTDKSIPQFVQKQELDSLLDQFEFSDDFKGARDKLILELLYGLGIRLSELIGLTDRSVDIYNQTVKVLGKRNKERIIPLSKANLSLIKRYRRLRDESVDVQSDCLLLTDAGKRCYPVMINRVVKKYLGAFTTVQQKSPHVLRHTFATHLLDNGADLNAVKDLLGHTSLAATQVYTHNSLEKLKSAFDQAHPKA